MKIVSRIFLVCLALSCAGAGVAQETVWESVDPGGNGGVTFTSIHPTAGYMYTSSDMSRSLFRSTDQGDTWEPIANPITGTPDYVAGDPSDPDTLYLRQIGVTPRGTGLWKSADNGDTWTLINQDRQFGGRNNWHSGLVDPDNGQILYWTAGDWGILRSTDGGYNWKEWGEGLPKREAAQARRSATFAYKLEFDPDSTLQNRRIFFPTPVGLYQASEPDGQWTLAGNIPKSECSAVAVCKGGIVYAALPQEGLFKSADGGKTWKQLTNGLTGRSAVRVAATDDRPDIVYVMMARVVTHEAKHDFGSDGIFGSTDGGESFRLLTHARFNEHNNFPINYRQAEGVWTREIHVAPNDPMTIYMIRGMKSKDGGKTWGYFGMKEIKQDRWKGTGLPLLTEYRAIFNPKKRNMVWLGFSDTGLMLSDDGGNSVMNVPTFHRAEVNQGAYWRDNLVFSSGSSFTVAMDPDMPSTIFASINGKTMELGGILIKSVNDGWDWQAITQKDGLTNGPVTSIVVDPSSPVFNRTVYVTSAGNAVFKSNDDGKTFENIGPGEELTKGNTRFMWLDMAKTDPQTLYLAAGGSSGIRPLYVSGMNGYPALKPGMHGGVYKTTNGGKTWSKCNSTREIASVQQVAVHPQNPDIVYAAAHSDYSLVGNSGKREWGDSGVFKTMDGGKTWEKVFDATNDEWNGQGDAVSVCVNPVCPEIVYTVVDNYGAYRSMDAGKTWEPLGKASMDRLQRRFFSIQLNPHDPAEVWIACFGTSFRKGIDYTARKYMEEKFAKANFVANPGFELLDKNNQPLYWSVEQPPAPTGEQPVFSLNKTKVKDGAYSGLFRLTEAYRRAPSTVQSDLPENRARTSKKGGTGGRSGNGATHAWIGQTIDPYFTTLMRGKRVAVEMDVFIAEGDIVSPRAFLSEARDYNVHWVVAETYLEDLQSELKLSPSEMKGKWCRVRSVGKVTDGAQWLRITVTGVPRRADVTEAYVDNVRLSIVD